MLTKEQAEAYRNYLLYIYDLATKNAPIIGKPHREAFADIAVSLFKLSSCTPEQQELVLRLMKGDKDAKLLELEMEAILKGQVNKG